MSNTTHTAAIFGLGSMGMGMANNMVKAGIKTYGFDVVPEQVNKFVNNGGQQANLSEVADTFDSVVLVVINAEQTKDILFGDDGIVTKLNPNTVIISCATVAPDFAKQMGTQCSEANILYLDAPISGGSIKANLGELSIMASGSEKAFTKAQVIIDAVSAKLFNLGEEPGLGSAMKAVNQLLAGVHIASMCEALTFGISQGITPVKFLEVISQCAGTSWMLENRAPHIIAGDYSPHSAIKIWPKDLGIVTEVANQAKFEAPLANTALEQFKLAAEAGLGKEDDAALAKIYAKRAKLELP